MNQRIDARLQRDLDAKGFDKVSELGCRHYALKFDEFNRQCVAWISCQLELARARARYDHDEQETVEEYQDQLAQCRQLAREVSARVSHETHELVPAPPAVPQGKADSDEIVVNSHLSAWAEFEEKRLVYWYLIKLNSGLHLEVKTDVNRVIIRVYPATNRTPNIILKEIKRTLQKGKPFLMSAVQSLVDFAQQRATARVHAEPNELAPMPPALNPGSDQSDDMTIDKNKRMWSEKIKGELQFSYWTHVRMGLFMLINTDADRKIVSHETIGVFKRDVDEKELSALLVKGKKLTMKMLNEAEEICKHKAVEARVSVDHDGGLLPERDFTADGHKWKYTQKGQTAWYDCKLRSVVFMSLMVSDGCICDAFVTISGVIRKESDETRMKLLDIIEDDSKPTFENLRAVVAVLAPKRAVTARVAGEQDGLVPRHDFSANGNHWSVEEGESSHLYKTKVAANTWLLINVENNLIESVWLEDALMRRRPSKANDRLHEFLTRGPRPIATQDAFKTIVKIASRDRSFDAVALSSMTALEIIQARVDFEKDMIRDASDLPSKLEVCKGELELKDSSSSMSPITATRRYAGQLTSHRNGSVYVEVDFHFSNNMLNIYLEGSLIAGKRCSLRFPFTRSALAAYVEAELCDVID